MKKIDERKKYLILVIVTAIVCIIALIGTTYAVLTMTIEGDKSITITAGILKVDFTDGNYINLDNVTPMSDSKGLQQEPYTFTITNNGNINAYYHVLLEEDSANTLANTYLKMKITSDNGYDSGVINVSDLGSNYFEIIEENTLSVGDSVIYSLWM